MRLRSSTCESAGSVNDRSEPWRGDFVSDDNARGSDGAKRRVHGIATLSAGRRAVAGSLTLNYRERRWAFGDGATHRAEARPRSGKRESAMPFAEWRAVGRCRIHSCGRASECPGGAAHAASPTRSGDARVGSNGDRERKRRWRAAPSRDARHRERSIQTGRSLARERRTGLVAEAGAAAKRPCS